MVSVMLIAVDIPGANLSELWFSFGIAIGRVPGTSSRLRPPLPHIHSKHTVIVIVTVT